MGQSRTQLQAILEEAAGEGNKAYFQPPENLEITYPCIVYERDYRKTEFAGNKPYSSTKRYQVTIIDRKPDSPIADRVAALPMSSFSRAFKSDGLNHDIYTLYF